MPIQQPILRVFKCSYCPAEFQAHGQVPAYDKALEHEKKLGTPAPYQFKVGDPVIVLYHDKYHTGTVKACHCNIDHSAMYTVDIGSREVEVFWTQVSPTTEVVVPV